MRLTPIARARSGIIHRTIANDAKPGNPVWGGPASSLEIPRRSPGPKHGPPRGQLFHLLGIPIPIRADLLADPGAIMFSQPSALRRTPVRSIEGDSRKGMACPSLDFGKEA